MSTHVKNKDNYFYSKEDEIVDDIDEFPTDAVKRNTDYKKGTNDESSLYKYQEYKKMYFEDAKQKKNKQIIESNYATEQNKYKKLLNSHFNKGKLFECSLSPRYNYVSMINPKFLMDDYLAVAKQGVSNQNKKKNKSDYFNDGNHVADNRNVINFDVLSSEPRSNASKGSTVKHSRKSSEIMKDKNIIDKIVSKHISNPGHAEISAEKKYTKLHEYSQPKRTEEKESSIVKSGSLMSFEYNPKENRRESSNRNESYEIMELNSFNEIKQSDECEEEKYEETGLYGMFDKVLDHQKNFYEEGSDRHNTLHDLQDSLNDISQNFDSNVAESELSPRSKQIYKIVKIVKDHFREHSEAPPTTKDFYRIGKCIGKGAFGKVNLAVHKATQSLVAIKSINKQYLLDQNSKKKVMQEVYILKKIRHCNVVHFYETFETEKYILLVMELCGGGDLLNYVRKRRRLKEDLAKYFFKQIIEALNYIHKKNIVHRDIKLDNILLDHHGNVKIGDFGVSKLIRPGETMTEQ